MRCDECKFWVREHTDACEDWVPLNDNWGCCRRFPPIIGHTFAENEHGDWEFPVTLSSDWCGEFQPKPTDKPAEGA